MLSHVALALSLPSCSLSRPWIFLSLLPSPEFSVFLRHSLSCAQKSKFVCEHTPCRMRGIGKGQTVTFITPPEVARLVQAALSLGRGVASGAHPAPQSGRSEEGLRDLVAWLLLNGMRSEHTQARKLYCALCSLWQPTALRLYY